MSIVEFLPDHLERYADLDSRVSQLVQEFPSYDEYDLAALVEERSRKPVRQKELDIIRAIYLRSRFQVFQLDEGED